MLKNSFRDGDNFCKALAKVNISPISRVPGKKLNVYGHSPSTDILKDYVYRGIKIPNLHHEKL